MRSVGAWSFWSNSFQQFSKNILFAAVGTWPLWRKCNELPRAALCGEWEKARTILDILPALGNPDTDLQVVGVHYDDIAVFSMGAGKRTISFVEQLVRYLPDWSLAKTNEDGISVLHVAAAGNNKAAAILLVERMPDLIYAVDSSGDYPVHRAARFSHKDVLQYLMPVTHWDGVRRPIAAADGQL